MCQHDIDPASSSTSSTLNFIQYASLNATLNLRYSVGAFAKIEQALQDYIYDKLSSLEAYEHIKSVSMFKSALVEGCGQNFNDSRKIFNIVRFSSTGASKHEASHIELLHLTGNSSLNALILNFVRTQTLEKYLPWTVFTSGKFYSPKHGQTSSVNLLTLCGDKSLHIIDEDKYDVTDLDAFLGKGQEYLNEIKATLAEFTLRQESAAGQEDAFDHTNKNIDTILVDMLKLMVHVFKDFNLPMRFSCLNPSKLNSNEALRIELQCYLPSEQHYVTVSQFFFLVNIQFKRLNKLFWAQNIIYNSGVSALMYYIGCPGQLKRPGQLKPKTS